MTDAAQFDVVVVGAGAAGLGAASVLRDRQLTCVVLEASHRTGGRAHTETVGERIAFDLGCHWLHSASLNPLVAVADRFGFRYETEPPARRLLLAGRWIDDTAALEWEAFNERAQRALRSAFESGNDDAVYHLTERSSPWSALFDYWVSVDTGADPDQVGAADLVSYRETHENWPLVAGYGALMSRFAEGLPVHLNTAVERIDWHGRGVRLHTSRGSVRACHVIVTVSTAVLGAGQIRFDPALPEWKQQAVADLSLGANNNACLLFERNVFGDVHGELNVAVPDGDVPMLLRIRPFDTNHVKAYTGGRHAAWLERAGVDATVALVKEHLGAMFGSDVVRQVSGHRVSAWCADPLVRGSYSFAAPGRFASRERLAQPLGERLHFAGEATSSEFFATCHGAYLTGVATANQVADALGAAQTRPKTPWPRPAS